MRSLTFTRTTLKDGKSRSETIGELHVGRLSVEATTPEVEQLVAEVRCLPTFIRWISPSVWARGVGVHFASPYLMASWTPSAELPPASRAESRKAPSAVA